METRKRLNQFKWDLRTALVLIALFMLTSCCSGGEPVTVSIAPATVNFLICIWVIYTVGITLRALAYWYDTKEFYKKDTVRTTDLRPPMPR